MVTSCPSNREEEEEWEECTIPVDPMRAAGIAPRRAGLTRRLDEGEDPILGLFLRFFPLQTYLDHLNVVASTQTEAASSRHAIPWDKGTFLRFLGVLIMLSMNPLPNSEWHWRWPRDLPPSKLASVKKLLREITFRKYW